MAARSAKRMKATAEADAERVVLSGRGIEVAVRLVDGTLGVRDPRSRWAPLREAFARVEFEDGSVVSTAGRAWSLDGAPRRFQDAHGRGERVVLASDADGVTLHVELCVYDEQSFALLRLGVENNSRTHRRVRSLTPLATAGEADGGLALAAPAPRWRWYRHGWQSWTPSLSLSVGQQDIDVRPPVSAPVAPQRGKGVFASEEVAVLLDPATGRSVVLGFVTAHRQWTQVRLRARERAIDATAFVDGATLRPGETMWSERLLVELTDGAQEALGRYAEALGREMGARVPAAPPVGWCSWYYYFWNVTEEEVLKNLCFLAEHREELPVQYVQIDDGYQANIGDWTTANEKFPRGMVWLAQQIREAGFVPGLWLAPLLVGETSQLFADYPDWTIRDERGEPVLAMQNWSQRCFGLDCTHPQAEAWLRKLFREVADGWGYQYVKIDFLYGGALAGRRYDKDASRIEAYRRGLSAIREAVGERFVLGCGALMGPSVGLVDGQRIGPDAAPWWRFRRARMERERGRPLIGGEPSMENAVRNVLTRAWMHGRLWANDPDCLLARSERTKLTLPEVQALATAIALSGGAIFLSDDMAQLAGDRIELISALLPPLDVAPAVPGLMTEAMPSTLEVRVTRPFASWRLLARFNWLRRRRALSATLPPGRWHVFEFWQGAYYGVREREVVLPSVPAHGVSLLSLRRALDRPQVVGTTFHAGMGAHEIAAERFDARRGTLRLELRPVAKRRGELFVHVPKRYRFVEALLSGEPLAPRGRGSRVLGFRFSLETRSVLALRFT